MMHKADALIFVEKALGIPWTEASENLSTPDLKRLTKLITVYQQRISFQNLSLLSEKPASRAVPCLDQIKSDGLGLLGGLCYTHNVFMMHLLSALGYKVYHAASTCNPDHPNNHIVTILEDLSEKGSLHLVDVGCGYPTYNIVDLGFSENISRVYTQGFLQYRFKRINNGCFERQHRTTFDLSLKAACSTVNEGLLGKSSERWERFYDFDLQPRELSYFHDAMSEVYTDRFLKKFRVLKFHENGDISALKEKGGDLMSMMISSNGIESKVCQSESEVIDVSHELTPNLSKETVVSAINSWREIQKVK